MKAAFPKQSKVLRDIFVRNKYCAELFVISNFLYGNEYWTFSSLMKRLEVTEIWLYRMILRNPRTDYMSNEDVLNKMGNRKRHLKFLYA